MKRNMSCVSISHRGSKSYIKQRDGRGKDRSDHAVKESGLFPVSRLGDAMRGAGMNPTAAEVGQFGIFPDTCN